MNIAYFDCFSGICGDMILGAFINLGLSLDYLNKELEKLKLEGYKIIARKKKINNITATDVYIKVDKEQPYRTYLDIIKMIDESSLDKKIRETSKKIFFKIASVESKIHQMELNKVHFHEVGAVDSIVDIIGTVIGREKLGLDEIISSPLPLGKGFIRSSHGILPVPAPATVEILKGIPVYQSGRKQELVTPTGAAIITTFTDKFIDMPMMKINKIGYGAGKTNSDYPNLLRIYIGEKILE